MDEIKFISLKYIEDERGAVLHFVKKGDPFFDSFGECYFSWINPGYVKGWYRQKNLISYLTSPTVNLRMVFFSGEKNKISVIDIKKNNYGLIKIPAGVWYSFKSLDEKPALIVNMLEGTYDPDSLERLEIDSPKIPYNWTKNA